MANPIAMFGPPTVITDAATQTFDCSTTSYFQWTLGASRTMSTPVSPANGHVIWIDVIQDATGSRLVTWPSNFRWPGVNTVAPVLQTQASGYDTIRAIYDGTNSVWRAGFNAVRVVPPAKDVANAAAGPVTNAVGDLTGAGYVSYRTTNAAPGTVTTRTATQMYADDPDAYVGKSWILNVNNIGVGTLTMAGGVGVTLTGTLTVLQNTTRTFFMTFASATTVTGQVISVGSVS